MARILTAADQAAERLCQPGADDAVVEALGSAFFLSRSRAPGAVQDGGAGPRHAFHDNAAQAATGNVDPVTQGIGAKQAGARIVAEMSVSVPVSIGSTCCA